MHNKKGLFLPQTRCDMGLITPFMGILIWQWILHVVFPTMLILAIYLYGLPFKKMRTKGGMTKKEVSHGLSTSAEFVTIHNSVWTEANVITGIGLLGVIDMVLIMLVGGPRVVLVPFILFWAGGLSDALDGLAAKKHDCHSRIGAIIDPVRDRCILVAFVLSIVTTVGFDAWLVPFSMLVWAEIKIALTGHRATHAGETLNTHGSGKMRQLAHFLIASTMFVVFYLTPLQAGQGVLVALVAVLLMSIASVLALVGYEVQLATILEEKSKRIFNLALRSSR